MKSRSHLLLRLTFLRQTMVLATIACLVACVSSHVLIGKPRPPISADQVTVYTQPPASYEQIARLDSTSRSSFSFGAQAKTNKVIQRLKQEAAKLGANGVLLQGISDQQSGSIGTGLGSASASGNSAVGVGLGTSFATYQKVGIGLAIYVAPN